MPLSRVLEFLPTVIVGSLAAMYGLALDVLGGVWSDGHPADRSRSDRPLWPRARLRRTLIVASSCAIAIGSASRLPMVGALLNAVLLPALIVLAFIDIAHHRLPNALVYPTALLSIAIVAIASLLGADVDVTSALGASVLYGGGLYVVARASGGGMGMGDVKVAWLIGWTLGAADWRAAAVAAGAAIVLGGIAGAIALARGAGRRSLMPYGPVLAAGAIIGGMWWPNLINASFLAGR